MKKVQDYQTFELKEFKLQNGSILDLTLAYQSYGRLNAKKDNVIVYPTFFGGRHWDNEWLIGPGRALDTDKYFIIVPNLFGNGLSSSPSNTVGLYGGAGFPQPVVYDNVLAQHTLLGERYGITKIKLAIGWSLGATQVFCWAAMFPNMIEKMVAFGGSSKPSSRFKLVAETAIQALKMDKDWLGGQYLSQPEAGVRLMARIYCPWAYSFEYFRQGLYKSSVKISTMESFIEHRWEKAFLQFDANDLVTMLQTGIQDNMTDLQDFKGDSASFLRAIRAKVLLMPGCTDLHFPVEESIREAEIISDARLIPIPSIWGHGAGIGINKQDNQFIEEQVNNFLDI